MCRYDQGREDGAVIDDWEDPKLEIYHTQDRYLVLLLSNRLTFYTSQFIQNDLGVSFLVTYAIHKIYI